MGEWYYNPVTKKMDVFFGTGSPAAYSIKASGIANVLYIYDFDNIVVDNLAGTLQIVSSSTKPGITTATIPIGAVSPAKKYIIGFSVKNSKDTIMSVYARQSAAPYKVLSNQGIVTVLRMNAARQDYELEFTPTADEANTVIFFETPSQSGTWWLDNIRIYEAAISETNVDDSVRFEYNASRLPKTINLTGTYIDSKGVVYKNSIVLQPYTSSILIKQDNSDAAAKPSNIAPTVSITTPVINAAFASTASITINATASDADGSITKVEYYNGNTLLHTEYTAPYSCPWTNVPAGNYVLTARATDNRSQVTTSAPVSISVKAGDSTLAARPLIAANGTSLTNKIAVNTENSLSAVTVKVGPNPASSVLSILPPELKRIKN